MQTVQFSLPQLKVLPPLSIYIHIPWCIKKCPYCDFNSHEARADIPEQQYIDALIADLDSVLPLVWGRKVYSVFFGGGTPSLLSAAAVDQILSALRARVALDTFAEITLEANPGTFETEKFEAYRKIGINRLSLGIQSFNEMKLKALGRVHNSEEACHAIQEASKMFENVNIDLMYGLPKQTVAEALSDIQKAIAFKPQHISAYHLTLEPNTLFHRYPPKLPDEDETFQMQTEIEAALAENGYEHYETSAFALPQKRCWHNLNYWTFGDYLGIGAGAHSKLSFPEKIIRQARYKQPRAYIQQCQSSNAIEIENVLGKEDLKCEFMMNALRLTDGFAANLFQERTGLPITIVQRPLEEAEKRGLIQRDHLSIAPTQLGQRFLNDLVSLFV